MDTRRKTQRRRFNQTRRALPKGVKKLSAPVKKAVANIAKKVVAKTEETKHACRTIENLTGHNSVISSADAVAVIPIINQGASDSQRIGNKIEPKGLYIKGRISMTQTAQTDNRSVYVRVMVLSQKNITDSTQVAGFAADQLLQANEGTTQNVAYDGTTRNSLYPVNKDFFKVHYSRDILITADKDDNTVPGTFGIEGNVRGTRKWGCKVSLPKHLTYFNDAATTPQNAAPFVVIGYCYADGRVPDSVATRITSTCVSTLYFKDA